jgi:mannose-1-phosphate guanylyltransferase
VTVTEAMIVAGGRGTRLQPLTFDTPKPLLPFCGAPFLAGVIARLAAVGVTKVWLVVGEDTEPFEVLRGPAAALGVEIASVPEPEPLDTAGGVREVIEDVHDTLLVLNGDILTDVDLAAVIAHHQSGGADATIVLHRVEDTSSYGVCVREGTRITQFVEKPAPGTLPGQDAINAGTYVIEPAVLREFPKGRLSFERQVFPGVLERGGHLEGFAWDGVWADLGTPERYREGTRLALSGALHWPTVENVPDRGDGVRIQAGAEVHQDAQLVGPVLVLAGASIAADAHVGPMTVIGHDARIGAAADVHGSVLFDRAEVGGGVRADGLLAGVGARVECGATLGRNVVLGDDQIVAGGAEVPDEARIPEPTG